jgi:hypothetical protein
MRTHCMRKSVGAGGTCVLVCVSTCLPVFLCVCLYARRHVCSHSCMHVCEYAYSSGRPCRASIWAPLSGVLTTVWLALVLFWTCPCGCLVSAGVVFEAFWGGGGPAGVDMTHFEIMHEAPKPSMFKGVGCAFLFHVHINTSRICELV